MALRRAADESIVVMDACRHTGSISIGSERMCAVHGISDCLMSYYSWSRLQDIAGQGGRAWRRNRDRHLGEYREAYLISIQACRFTGVAGSVCAEHGPEMECVETFLAASLVADFAETRYSWDRLRHKVLGTAPLNV